MSALDENNIYSQNYGTGSPPGGYKAFSSPYLNYDPAYLPQTQPEFIFLENGSKQRGRFELAFGQIGASCMVGASLGGAMGLYNGLRDTAMAGQAGKVRRTQLLNHIMKKGAATASTLGTIAVMYAAFGTVLAKVRDQDDDWNTIVSGTLTGCLYKSTGGLRSCGVGGVVGLGLSVAYTLWNNRDKVAQLRRYNPAER